MASTTSPSGAEIAWANSVLGKIPPGESLCEYSRRNPDVHIAFRILKHAAITAAAANIGFPDWRAYPKSKPL